MSMEFFNAAREASVQVAEENRGMADFVLEQAHKIFEGPAKSPGLPQPYPQGCIAKEILQAYHTGQDPVTLLPHMDAYLSPLKPELRYYSVQYLAIWLAGEQKFDEAIDLARTLRWAQVKADTYLDIAQCMIHFDRRGKAARLLATTVTVIAQDYANCDQNIGSDAEVGMPIYQTGTKAVKLVTTAKLQNAIGQGDDARQSIMAGLKALKTYNPSMP
jgi:hypothetical protein